MSKMSMTQMEVVAALMNGCQIQWFQFVLPSSPRFLVYSTDGDRVGRVSPATIEVLFELGFLKLEGSPVKDCEGSIETILVLDTPKMPFFRLEGGDQDA